MNQVSTTIAPGPLVDGTISSIEGQISQLLSLLGFPAFSLVSSLKEGRDRAGLPCWSLRVAIDVGPTGRLLIGVQGNRLAALQHVVRTILRRQLTSSLRVHIDINGYLAARERTLSFLAEEAARKANNTRLAVVLPPMDAIQRHIVHSHLASRHDVNTESLGEEPNRRIVVRPIF